MTSFTIASILEKTSNRCVARPRRADAPAPRPHPPTLAPPCWRWP